MANDPELEARVDRLEHEVKRAREDAAAARVLAGGVDRDVDDIRQEFRQYRQQNVQLHNATRADIAAVRNRISGVDGRLQSVEGRLEGVEGRLEGVEGRLGGLEGVVHILTLEMRSKFDMVAAGHQQIVDLINQKFDERDL